jgi:hypothetical protein
VSHIDRTPPTALDVEKALLGGLIVDSRKIAKIRAMVSPAAFSDPCHGPIWSTMVDMAHDGREVDIVTLAARLREIGKIKDVGGEVYLAELIENPGSCGVLEDYASIIVQKYVRRNLIGRCFDLQDRAYDENNGLEALLAEIEDLTSSLSIAAESAGIKKRERGTLVKISDLKKRVKEYRIAGVQNTSVVPSCSEIGQYWPTFSTHYRPAKATLNIFTGIPGHGKSEFTDALMLNTAVAHGWKWAVFSPENYPHERYIQKLTEKYVGKAMFGLMTDTELDAAMDYLESLFVLIEPYEDDITIDAIKHLSTEACESFGVDGITWDPWNEMELDVKDYEKENDAIGRNLSKIRRFARRKDVCMNIVAHPTKLQKDFKTKVYPVPRLYDINGSAHWYNKADNGITVYRNFDGDGADTIDVHVQKIKFKVHGCVGVTSFRYQVSSGRFVELDDNGCLVEAEQTKCI